MSFWISMLKRAATIMRSTPNFRILGLLRNMNPQPSKLRVHGKIFPVPPQYLLHALNLCVLKDLLLYAIRITPLAYRGYPVNVGRETVLNFTLFLLRWWEVLIWNFALTSCAHCVSFQASKTCYQHERHTLLPLCSLLRKSFHHQEVSPQSSH